MAVLNVVCVKAGDRYGADYVSVLHDMVTRNLPKGFAGRLICFTDDPTGIDTDLIHVRPLPHLGLDGWWNKLALFKPGVFQKGERILYLDLSIAVTGPLDDLVAYCGDFAILRDFYRPAGLQSAVMAWEAGKLDHIWTEWEADGFPKPLGGDQTWIEEIVGEADILQDFFPKQFVSYKVHARDQIPDGARIVKFHGQPKPDEICDGWVPHVWKVGGGTSAEFVYATTASRETLRINIQAAMKRETRWLTGMSPIENGTVLVCAGGPSLKDDLNSIRVHAAAGAEIVAVNGTLAYLIANGITPHAHVMCDGREENIVFVPDLAYQGERLYASQCAGSILDAAGPKLTLWHPYFDGILDITGDSVGAYIGGGTTAGLKAVAIAYARGVRKIHLYGFDSSYRGKDNHAYPQAMNEGERILDVTLQDGSVFRCAPWMVTQAEDFQSLSEELTAQGCQLFVHGDGLIPAMAAMAKESKMAPDLRANAILSRIETIKSPVVAEIGVFGGDLSKRLLARRTDLKLYMVDAWGQNATKAFADTEDFHAKMDLAAHEEYFSHAKAITSFAGERRTIIRALSSDAVHEIPDSSLDMVFIDADHSYEGCSADIKAYWPKVKPGGYLAGHDYDHVHFKFGTMVKQAVDEFVAAQNLSLDLGENYTWFAVKGTEGELNV